MSYWNHVQDAAGMSPGPAVVTLGLIAAGLLLAIIAPTARRRIFVGLLFYLAGFGGLLIAAAVHRWGPGVDSSAYRVTRYFSLLFAGVGIINVIGVLIFRVLLPAVRLEAAAILRDLVLAAAYVVLAFTLMGRMGVNLTGIVATSAVVTAVIGFSLQDTLGNIMGGLALQMERSISIGDWIRVGEHEGMVREIRWRQTTIETRNWDTVIIPNSALMKGNVLVLGRRQNQPRQTRLWVYFNVDFRHAPGAVTAAVEEALRAEPIANVAADPAPHCICTEFRDSYAVYAVRYWLTNLALTDPTNSEVRTRIYAALKRAGMSLSIPAQSVFFTSEDQSRKERKEQQDQERKLAALGGVELFAALTDEERRTLAGRLVAAPFARGEAITRQGSFAHWLYMLIKGTAEVRVAVDGGTQRVATLSPGAIFGEMGLMTGEPRSATVIAETDALCYRLDKESFTDILKRRPEIAESLSQSLARRRAELDAVREGLTEQAKRQRAASGEQDLLRKIKAFFTLD